MNKNRAILIFLGMAALLASACVKQASLDAQLSSTTRYLLTGKWLVTSRNVKVSDNSKLVKDTTFSFAAGTASAANKWILIFNKDSTAYVTTLPYIPAGTTKAVTDTTSRLKYTIVGGNRNIVFTYTNGTAAETDLIILLTGFTLETSNTYQATPAAGWGLDATKTYSYTEDIRYTKQ